LLKGNLRPQGSYMDSTKKTKYIAAGIAFIFMVLAIYFLFIRQQSEGKIKTQESANIVKNVSDVEVGKRPYITLVPTSDGAEIIISIEKMSDFDKIEYELTYQADNPQSAGEKIERGATGSDINPKDEKYKKSILLGTGSKGVRSPDRNIEGGKLTLHLFKGDIEYQSETNWDMFQIGPRASKIKSRDDKLELSLPALSKQYWIILADTVGIPPNNESLDLASVILPVFGAFSIAPNPAKALDIKIKLDSPDKNLVLRTYLHQDSRWDETIKASYDSASQTLTSKVKSYSTYVVSTK